MFAEAVMIWLVLCAFVALACWYDSAADEAVEAGAHKRGQGR